MLTEKYTEVFGEKRRILSEDVYPDGSIIRTISPLPEFKPVWECPYCGCVVPSWARLDDNTPIRFCGFCGK
jgi:hypothetical protein